MIVSRKVVIVQAQRMQCYAANTLVSDCLPALRVSPSIAMSKPSNTKKKLVHRVLRQR
jgi:hypothetical protein